MSMRIVVEPGGYGCHNMGDVAMMQVAVARLNEMWPGAQVEVITACPDLLARYCPSSAPLPAEARGAWLSGRSLIGGLHRKLPAGISAFLFNLEKELWLRCPKVAEVGVQLKTKLLHGASVAPSAFRKRLVEADLLVLSGAGMINDAFVDSASPLLDELEFVLRAGVPIVAFGQGIGPVTNPVLLAKMKAVFPHLKLISLRDGNRGLPHLESLGVPRERIHVTGDDAIEIAFQCRQPSLGDAIGINVRLAGYAGTGEEIIARLREPLRCAAQALNSSLIPVPISLHESDSDVKSADKLLGVRNHDSKAVIEEPKDVIRLIGRCRVVVTGGYHSGVFALAQGIPVVGLVQSPYYEQKFTGLQKQFPRGCRILDFRQPVTSSEIQNAIREAWESAEPMRESLLRAAAYQVELSRAAYKAAYNLLPLNSDR